MVNRRATITTWIPLFSKVTHEVNFCILRESVRARRPAGGMVSLSVTERPIVIFEKSIEFYHKKGDPNLLWIDLDSLTVVECQQLSKNKTIRDYVIHFRVLVGCVRFLRVCFSCFFVLVRVLLRGTI